MDLIIKAIEFADKFNGGERDGLLVEILIRESGVFMNLYEESFHLSTIRITSEHDLESFIDLCKRAREHGE